MSANGTLNRVNEAAIVADNITRLTEYHPGKPIEEVEREIGITGIIKLASNENSLGPSPLAQKAMQDYASKMHIYPDASSFELKKSLSSFLNVSPDQIVFGNGSDDIIHLLGITFLEPGDEVIQAHPSFVRYESAAVLNNAPCHLIPLTADWKHDLDAMAAKINEKTRLIFICNPNNPTGTVISQSALKSFMKHVPSRAIVVLDEAYFEYASEAEEYPDSLEYIRGGQNVITLRTFSKAYGLAGIRVGYGVMPAEIAAWLNRSREPFNVNLMAQIAAVAALKDVDHVAKTIAMNKAGKRVFYAAFDSLGLKYTPSHANFVWVDVGRNCRDVYTSLLHKGVITRTGDVFGAPSHLRVTIGTEAENCKFITALENVLS